MKPARSAAACFRTDIWAFDSKPAIVVEKGEKVWSVERAMMDFLVHPRLAADTVFVADWTLSRVLAMNDARYPWVILVPRRAAMTELFELDEADRAVLVEETSRAASGLKRLTGAEKINVAMLGNVVRQLHVHVVGRNKGDAAWPGPVWGRGEAVAYAPPALADFVARLVKTL